MCSVCVWLDSIYLCGVQYIHDFGEDRVFTFAVLAEEFDVSQLPEVEVPLLLQPVYSLPQIQQLWADRETAQGVNTVRCHIVKL